MNDHLPESTDQVAKLNPMTEHCFDHFTFSLLVQVVKQGIECDSIEEKHGKFLKVAQMLGIDLELEPPESAITE